MSRGAPRYIAILAALQRGPAITTKLQAQLGINGVINLRMNLRLMRRYGLVHVAGYQAPQRPDGGGMSAVIWGFGPGVDAQPVAGAAPPKAYPATSIEMLAFAGFVGALERGPFTAAELAEESTYPLSSVWVLLRRMHQAGLVHVECWDRAVVNSPTRAWALGAGRDAPKPQPETKRAIEVRSYGKRRARAEQGRMLAALMGAA